MMNTEVNVISAQTPERASKQSEMLPLQVPVKLYTSAEYSAIQEKLKDIKDADYPVW